MKLTTEDLEKYPSKRHVIEKYRAKATEKKARGITLLWDVGYPKGTPAWRIYADYFEADPQQIEDILMAYVPKNIQDANESAYQEMLFVSNQIRSPIG